MKKVETFKTDDDKTYLMVVKEHDSKRTDLFLYLYINEPNQDVSLVTWETIVDDGHGSVVNPVDVADVTNDENKFKKAIYTTNIGYKFIPGNIPQPHVKYLEYFLLGTDHKITLTTPQGNQIVVD